MPSSDLETIAITLDQERKQVLEKAAAKRLLNLTEYLMQIAMDTAAQEMAVPESITLSTHDWEIVTAELENAPPPNSALRAAIQAHQDEYGAW